ncbi:MAG TPA: SUF system NifU family Fe-S cluster assembly protein [Candidatus Kapabacteria bacterium]|nr:SUF system NifU family Fe-S cluster assembly protein [Candidatus Kapabacteria bacterium]
MMSELNELYQQVILDHNKSPKNFRKIENATKEIEGYNPLCGDHIMLYLLMDGDVIKDISFTGSGCAISKASTSMMTAAMKGKTIEEAEKLFENFHAMVSGDDNDVDKNALGSLKVFEGVKEFPARVKCAILAWHTLHAALEGQEEMVSTEGDEI